MLVCLLVLFLQYQGSNSGLHTCFTDISHFTCCATSLASTLLRKPCLLVFAHISHCQGLVLALSSGGARGNHSVLGIEMVLVASKTSTLIPVLSLDSYFSWIEPSCRKNDTISYESGDFPKSSLEQER